MMDYDFKPLDTKLADAKEWLAKEYRSLRTGRASPAILDSVMVSAYGSMTPLKQVGNVSTEDARTLRVSAYDPGVIKDIERAISAANLGVGKQGSSCDPIGVFSSQHGGLCPPKSHTSCPFRHRAFGS